MSMCQYIKGSAYAPCLCTKKEEKCRICCRYSSGNVTEECKPFDDVKNMFGPYYLSKGRPCHDGICNQNVSEFLKIFAENFGAKRSLFKRLFASTKSKIM